MSTFQTLIARLVVGDVSKAKAGRFRGRRLPSCEAMESRQLMNGAWGGPHGAAGGPHGPWEGPGGAGGPGVPAQFDHAGVGGHSFRGGHAFPAPSAQVQADMKALQADTQALQTEIPASLTAQLKADKALIDQALAQLTPAQRQAMHGAPHSATTGGTDPSAGLAAVLQSANVPDAQAKSIVADFQNFKTTLANLDPALHAKITADQAALQKDLGPNHHGHPFDTTAPGLMP